MAGERERKKTRRGRRARGTGSIFYSAAHGRWVGRKPVGRSAAGKTVYVERWGATQGEVVAKLAAATPPGPDTTVAGWAARWRRTLTVRDGTGLDYAISLDKHILPAIGHLRLTAVTTAHVERLAADLLRAAAATTVHKILSTARAMFSAAVRADLVPKNPVSLARKPKRVRRRVEPFTPGQLLDIVAASAGYSCGGVLATQAAVGCRVGEAIGLDVGDFDPAAKTLRITKTLTAGTKLGPPKSVHSLRTITVPDVLLPVLAAVVGDRVEGPLFRTNDGGRFRTQMAGRTWRLVLRDLGLPLRRGHVMRHSVVTHLIAAGHSPADVAAFVGDSVATLVRVYLHPTGADPADTLNRLYGGCKVGGSAATPTKRLAS